MGKKYLCLIHYLLNSYFLSSQLYQAFVFLNHYTLIALDNFLMEQPVSNRTPYNINQSCMKVICTILILEYGTSPPSMVSDVVLSRLLLDARLGSL